jgi:hypothetical protein
MSGTSALKEAPQQGEGVNPDHPLAARVTIVDREQGLVAGTRKKIAICGFASSSRDYMPMDKPEWEIWGLNQLYRHVPRADRWFDIHWNWNEEVVPGTDHRAWIRDCGIPVYMTQTHPDLPTSVRYPLERMAAWGADYFTSTIAYMTALAVWEIDQQVDARLQNHDGPLPTSLGALREIYGEYAVGIYGVDLVVGEEYFWQKACAEFWIGMAVARGIKLHLPPTTALCTMQNGRYGFDRPAPQIVTTADVDKHAAMVGKQREEHLRQLYLMDGALQSASYFRQLIELRERGAQVG